MLEGLEFFKMSGGGNDFIVADNRRAEWNAYSLGKLARGLCRPHLSIGADGLILVESSKKAHLKVRIFNSDGTESPMCGNGARCAARFAMMKVIAGRAMTMEMGPSVLSAEVLSDLRVRVEIPGGAEPPRRIDIPVKGRSYPGFLTRTGVPHLVVCIRDQEALRALPVSTLGAMLRRAPEVGPEGANVDFVALTPAPPFALRTFERGVEAETLACGTGVTAAAWVLRHLGLAGDTVSLRAASGSMLEVDISGDGSCSARFTLTGEARLVFRGVLAPESLEEAQKC